MRECKIKENLEMCSCTYEPCSRKGICCECLRYHLSKRQVPACFFPAEIERTYDRSIDNFIKVYSKK
ncbi:MAG: DUF6485 family protein [Candidatus Omnitrophica bacterium]|nr:DUF6485 family protein [Candidatus Omnitrophota bacterium]MCM8799433.1 DUF6485 family protein [Candidatus Omnitrophota bacterium]